MPELPEVAYQKKYADATILHKKIVKIETGDKKIYQSAKSIFEETLKDNQFTGSERLGKYLFLKLEKQGVLVVHFGMTGKLEYYQHEETPKYAQLTLTFEDHSRVSFTCPRKFGKLYLTKSLAEFQKENNLGVDALALKEEEFFKILKTRTGTIKALLMNQKLIAGIGNLYADEILFQVKIHPTTKVDQLSEKEKTEIFKEIEEVLEVVKEARIEGSKLPKSYLTSVRKKYADCPKNNGSVSSTLSASSPGGTPGRRKF
ncbi:DNA-formamidopyrimidine glycosylase family protein [Salegentibacter salegens]|uniref:Formamidopyrimidine-DNA glycosylase n=1 Tax=Salegentibacter salegens TaxID=143223 RepID=A0A1M7MKU6_9FLAO|nr:DNA-formamidopyrimidine glycosylase family protein [Salegentibacter salegens]PRX48185.1 formamidopyrimidine-DNA glycosylase [Salegentibacter salegens]SHM91569.1 formamidopyrimidine-DNA glycosylase [Salegentibacter salegens]